MNKFQFPKATTNDYAQLYIRFSFKHKFKNSDLVEAMPNVAANNPAKYATYRFYLHVTLPVKLNLKFLCLTNKKIPQGLAMPL